MKLTYIQRDGKHILFLESESQNEDTNIENFARDGDTFTGKIESGNTWANSVIVLEKEM